MLIFFYVSGLLHSDIYRNTTREDNSHGSVSDLLHSMNLFKQCGSYGHTVFVKKGIILMRWRTLFVTNNCKLSLSTNLQNYLDELSLEQLKENISLNKLALLDIEFHSIPFHSAYANKAYWIDNDGVLLPL